MQRSDVVLRLLEVALELLDLDGQIVKPFIAVGVKLSDSRRPGSSRPKIVSITRTTRTFPAVDIGPLPPGVGDLVNAPHAAAQLRFTASLQETAERCGRLHGDRCVGADGVST